MWFPLMVHKCRSSFRHTVRSWQKLMLILVLRCSAGFSFCRVLDSIPKSSLQRFQGVLGQFCAFRLRPWSNTSRQLQAGSSVLFRRNPCDFARRVQIGSNEVGKKPGVSCKGFYDRLTEVRPLGSSAARFRAELSRGFTLAGLASCMQCV